MIKKKDVDSTVATTLGFLPLFLTSLTILVGVYQYNKTSEKEIRKEFFYKQVSCYEKLTDKVTNMLYTKCIYKDSLRMYLNDFRKFRHGEYSLYTTDSVEKYASGFELYYDRFLKNDLITIRDLEIVSYKLSDQCRLSLNQTLEVNLGKITFRKSLN